MITHPDKFREKDHEELENEIRAEHIEDHREEPDYLCKYCIRDRLELLDSESEKSIPKYDPDLESKI